MSYKTILVHLNDERRVAGLVEAAAHLASRYQSHLIGLYALPPVPTYGATAAGAGMIKSGLNTFVEEAKRVQAKFEHATAGRPFVSEWRLVSADRLGFAETIMEHGRAADLIMVGQRDGAWAYSTLLDEPERLAIESGRPVIIVPHSGKFPIFGRRITLAWNGRREAARAAFDALPLLKAAESVRIVWINPQDEANDTGDIPAAEIAVCLSRHGVKCETAKSFATDVKVGDVLLSDLADDGSDLLVMGAYGSSRIREFVFGGTTRHILRSMTVPVFMSH
ncbi:MAG: universal stress protein [Hyphomicrobiaceae bacterium]